MAGSANNAAKPTAGSNMAAADDGATASAAVEPSEIHKVPGVFDLAGRIVCGGKVDRAARYIAPTVLYGTSARCAGDGGGDFRADSADSWWSRMPSPQSDSSIKRSRPLAAYVFSRDHEVRLDFRTSDQLRSPWDIRCRWAICCPAGCRSVAWARSGIGAYHGKAGLPHLQPRQNRGYQAAVPRHSAPRVPALQ